MPRVRIRACSHAAFPPFYTLTEGLRVSLSVVGVDDFLRRQITLVAHHHLEHFLVRKPNASPKFTSLTAARCIRNTQVANTPPPASTPVDFIHPLLDVVEGFLICNVIYDDDTVCATVVGRGNSTEALLYPKHSSVPASCSPRSCTTYIKCGNVDCTHMIHHRICRNARVTILGMPCIVRMPSLFSEEPLLHHAML